jgi:hypothetical protein
MPVTTDLRQEPVGLEAILIAFVATCGVAVALVHSVALAARAVAGEAGPSDAAAVTWTMGAVAATFAVTHIALRRGRMLSLAGPSLSLVGAVWFAARHPGAPAVAITLLLAGTAQTGAAIVIARRLSFPFSGTLRRRPAVALLWGILALLFLIQDGRLSTYMADPSVDWWLTTSDEFWSRHMCMPAYIEAADLHRQGISNVYAAEHYAALTRTAKPALTVRNMEAFAGDPYQYPPQFLLLPHLALKVTNDFLVLRTTWYAVQIVGFVLVAVALCAWIGSPIGLAAALLIPAVWLSVPVMQSLQYGQFHLAAVMLAVGGMLAMERRRNVLGGALLAAATLAKIFPGILLVYLLARRQWRAVAWTAGFAAALSLVALLILGSQPFRAFVVYQLPRMQSGEAFDFAKDHPEYRVALIADNFSPAGLVSKLHELGVPGMTPRLGRLALGSYALLLLPAAWVAGRRQDPRRDQACLWLAVLNLAALQSPGAFADYVTLGSVWLLALLPDQFRNHPVRASFLAACWVFFALVPGIPPVPASLSEPAMMTLTAVGVVLLLGFNAWVLLRTPPGRSPHADA